MGWIGDDDTRSSDHRCSSHAPRSRAIPSPVVERHIHRWSKWSRSATRAASRHSIVPTGRALSIAAQLAVVCQQPDRAAAAGKSASSACRISRRSRRRWTRRQHVGRWPASRCGSQPQHASHPALVRGTCLHGRSEHLEGCRATPRPDQEVPGEPGGPPVHRAGPPDGERPTQPAACPWLAGPVPRPPLIRASGRCRPRELRRS